MREDLSGQNLYAAIPTGANLSGPIYTITGAHARAPVQRRRGSGERM